MTHTPGPWHTDHLTKHGYYQVRNSKRCICSLRWDDSDHTIEDARLIAAAPALLEALEKIAKINADYTVTSNQTYKDMWKQQREIARAAVAQAKGEKE